MSSRPAIPVAIPLAIPWTNVVLSVAEMYAADKKAEALGTASLDLMEAAGTAVMKVLRERWPAQPVAVLCGPGNNGGDGFVVARHLHEAGWPVRVALAGAREDLRGDAGANAARWQGEVRPLRPDVLEGRPLVVDALFGAGLSRALDGAARAVVDVINDQALTCIAVDIPSGVAGDSGEVLEGIGSRCAITVTFFRRKPGHLLYPGRALCGEVIVADIGIPERVLSSIAPQTARNTPHLWTLPEPTWRDHKYDHGHVTVIGSATMTGAARLAARGACRVGAGAVTMAVPTNAVPIYAADAPGVFVRPIESSHDLEKLLADERRNSTIIGPGMDVGLETAVRALNIIGLGRAAVLDAGALASFEEDPEHLFAAIRRAEGNVIMTPHAGEFAKLFRGKAYADTKLRKARAAAEASGAVIVLKGPDTVVAAPDGRAAITDNAPPWLATAGSGDVLAGIIAGLLGQGMAAFEAGCAAVWLHGAAGAAAGRGLIAEDLPERLPGILAKPLESH